MIILITFTIRIIILSLADNDDNDINTLNSTLSNNNLSVIKEKVYRYTKIVGLFSYNFLYPSRYIDILNNITNFDEKIMVIIFRSYVSNFMFGFEKMKHFRNNVIELEMSEKSKLISNEFCLSVQISQLLNLMVAPFIFSILLAIFIP